MKRRNIALPMLAAVALTSAWTGIVAAGELETLQAEWWQWAMAIPASHSPIFDKTGNRCGIAQRGDVWFLAGSTGAKVTRTCSVPAGVRLFVPVVNTFCFPDAAFSESFCGIDTDDFIGSFQLGTA
jgi:hypothetical protein